MRFSTSLRSCDGIGFRMHSQKPTEGCEILNWYRVPKQNQYNHETSYNKNLISIKQLSSTQHPQKDWQSGKTWYQRGKIRRLLHFVQCFETYFLFQIKNWYMGMAEKEREMPYDVSAI